MGEYIIRVAGVVVISALFGILMPSGKIGVFMQGILRLAILYIIVSPVIGWITQGQAYLPQAGEMSTDSAFIEYAQKRQYEALLADKFGIEAEVTVEENKIYIFISDFGINAEGEHINIIGRVEQTIAALSAKEVIVTYGG